MPQLDLLMIHSQLYFLFFFIFGYFFFLKYILPVVTFEMKIKQKILLSHMVWFSNSKKKYHYFNFSDTQLIIIFSKLVLVYKFFLEPRPVIYSLTEIDLFFYELSK